jgi:hypothetical protein
MLVLVVVVAAIALAAAVRVSVLAVRRWRMASELRGDWWGRFEREFRTYADMSWQAARESERRD